jgi:hypothetical protein
MQRSALANDPYRLRGVNGCTAEARRFRGLVGDYGAMLGGVDGLGVTDIALVRAAAASTMLSESMAASLARGELVSEEQMTRANNVLGRQLRRIEKRAVELRPRDPSLSDILRGARR